METDAPTCLHPTEEASVPCAPGKTLVRESSVGSSTWKEALVSHSNLLPLIGICDRRWADLCLSVILITGNTLFSDMANSFFSFFFLTSLSVRTLSFLKLRMVVLALVVCPERRQLGLGLCIREGKGGTRYILRFLWAPRTTVLSLSWARLLSTWHRSAWPCFGPWILVESTHGSPLPKAPLPHTCPGGNLARTRPVSCFSVRKVFLHELLPSAWVQVRLQSADRLNEETHTRPLWEQRLCTVRLTPRWAERLGCQWQNLHVKPTKAKEGMGSSHLSKNAQMRGASFLWGLNPDSVCTVVRPSWPGCLGGRAGLTAVNGPSSSPTCSVPPAQRISGGERQPDGRKLSTGLSFAPQSETCLAVPWGVCFYLEALIFFTLRFWISLFMWTFFFLFQFQEEFLLQLLKEGGWTSSP